MRDSSIFRNIPASGEIGASVFGYKKAGGELLVTLWRASDPPGKRPEMEDITVRVSGEVTDPVWVDLVSGKGYDIDDSFWKQEGGVCTFARVPVYDAAVVIAELADVRMKGTRGSASAPRTTLRPRP